jgi:hypothetical protein
LLVLGYVDTPHNGPAGPDVGEEDGAGAVELLEGGTDADRLGEDKISELVVDDCTIELEEADDVESTDENDIEDEVWTKELTPGVNTTLELNEEDGTETVELTEGLMDDEVAEADRTEDNVVGEMT